ncbi:LamG-like jellyroll fold domain-containing protein [Yinghuangia sp. YIM S10712]|uniref:LamG-like jellyroll fold domain-containing protein n=1 Tax=Yinghuangia sp. YIM S10712 TaxID=3436930 RepID=UPI003F531CBF
MEMGGRPSGWYQDPSGRPNSQRWWDGSAWTEGYRSTSDPAGSPTVSAQASVPPPAPREPEANTSVFPPAAYDTPSWNQPRPVPTPVQFEAVEPDRTKKRVISIAITVVLVVVAGVGGFLIGTSGDDGKEADTASASAPPPAAGEASAPVEAPAPPVPSTPDPTGRWRLADGQGTTAADATGKQPATVTGNVKWSPDRGGSIVVAGDGSLGTARGVVDTSKSFTVAAWAKVSATDGHKTIVAQDGAKTSGFLLHYNGDAHTWAFVRTSEDSGNPAAWYTALATSPFAKDTWTHLVGVYDAVAGRITLYVNGVAQSSTDAPMSWNATGPLTIGRSKNNSDLFSGGIADVAVFDRALTAEEIKSLPTDPGPANPQ